MALITAANYKTFASIGDANLDTLIAALIPLVEARIAKHCNRLFEDGSTARTEYFDGDGLGSVIVPKYFPVGAITSLHDDPDRGYGDAYLIDSDDYVAYDNRVELDGLVFASGLKNIKLVYVGGYITTGESANVPDDLKLAVYSFISWVIARIGKEALQSESIAHINLAQQYVTEVPTDIRAMLASYKRHAFG